MLFLFLYSLPIAIAAFIFESYPRFINRYCGVDIWTHLLYLKAYHKQKGIPKKIDGGFLVPGRYDYPPAFIFLLSKLPLQKVVKYEFLFSPFFDAVYLILIFFFSYYITHNIVIAFLTQIIYVLTPIIVLENSSATPRSLGYTLFMLCFASLFLFESTQNYFLLFFAVIAGSLIFISHRFTTQSFLFFVLFFSLITHSLWYMIVFIVAFFIALIISKGFYFTVLQGHIGNLRFWRNNIRYRFAHQVRGVKEQHKTNDFVFRLYNQFLRFPPFVLAITNPWVLSGLFFYYFTSVSDPIVVRFGQLILFSYILALATIWIPQLRFLGEGQRYLELSAFPAALLSAMLVTSMGKQYSLFISLLYGAVGIGALATIVVIQRKAIIKDKLRTLTPSLRKMFLYLKSLKSKPSLLCIPHQMTTSTIYHTGCPVFVNADYASIEKIADVYPFLRKPIRIILKQYKLDAILLNMDYAKPEELKLGKYTVLKKYDNYLLLKPL